MKKTTDSHEHKEIDLNAYFIFGAIILVFLLGMYAIFSPGVQVQGNPACGKIVIAADGATLRANVAKTLQEATHFLVVDPLSSKLVEAVKNPYRGPQPSAQIAYLVAGKGEEAVIVGNIDQQSYNILMQFGIRTFGGYTGQAKKVITLYRQARISSQSPRPETLTQPSMPTQAMPVNMPVQQVQPAAWGMTVPGPLYPNAFSAQQAALAGLPDGDTIRRNNAVTQVALAQQAAAQYVPVGGVQGYFPPSQYPASQYPQANTAITPAAMAQAAMAQAAIAQAAMAQAAMAPQPPANVANNPLWERAAAAVTPQQQGNITWELAAAQQQAAMTRAVIAQQAAAQQQVAMAQAAMAQQAAAQQQAAMTQAAMAQAAMAQQPPANVANNPMWERAAVAMAPSQQGNITWEQAALAPVAAQVPVMQGPPIYSNAQMPHPNRGSCVNCHQIIDAQTNAQNAQRAAANQMMWNDNMVQDQTSVRAGVGNGAVR